MSDALCGPANPLQQFKQQSQLDRSLQQDRLTSRPSPAQGFRSADPNTGLLDPEFEAFQAGAHHLPDLPQFQHGPPQQSSQRFAPAPAPAGPAWAADFQQMRISSPPPMQRSIAGPAPAHANHVAGDWASAFRSHIAQNPQVRSPAPSFQQPMNRSFVPAYGGSFQQTHLPAVHTKGKEPMQEHFDDAAFERAFDQARGDLMRDDAATTETIYHERAEISQNARFEHDHTVSDPMSAPLDPDVIGDGLTEMERDILQEELHKTVHPAEEQQTNIRNDDDALAATAQELLEKIEHNQTDKFKNSQFLGLMRKLRDREVKVQGDQMVETTAATFASEEASPFSPAFMAALSSEGHYQRPATPPTSQHIPSHEQDEDVGRVNPEDGQEVVDLLNQRGPISTDIDPEFMMTSPFYQP